MASYNHSMILKDEFIAYRARWQAVAEVEVEEQKAASYELHWMQLNAIYSLASGLGILMADPSEKDIYRRWAVLK